MTRRPVEGRGAGVLIGGRWLDAAAILAAILVVGLLLRILIGAAIVPLSGFRIDINDFAAWGQRLASVGPGEFYEADYFSDYPPGYLYVLWLLGIIGSALAPIVGQDATAGLVKLPGVLADIGVAWLLFVICRRWGAELFSRAGRPWVSQAHGEWAGLLVAALYLFNPATIFNAAVWGQVDSVGTLILLATIYFLARGWTEAAAVGAVVALLVKFQFAFIIPIVLIVGVKRHLLGRSADPEHDGRGDRLRVLTSLAAGFGSLVALLLPFGMSIYAPLPGGDPNGLLGFLPEADPTRSLIGKFVEAAGTYTGLSVNAINLWRNPWSGLGEVQQWGDDTTVGLILAGWPLTWQTVGSGLFALVAIIALWQVARRDDLRGVLIACLLLAIAFFVLPTRVHERYLFPALALALPLIPRRPAWAAIYGAITVVVFANIYWVYTYDWDGFGAGILNPGVGGLAMPQDPILRATLLAPAGIYLLAALIVVVMGIVAWRSLRMALRPDDEPKPLREPGRPPDPREWEGADEGLAPVPPARVGLGWLQADPADPYLREPTRRLDRLDAALLLGLVLFAFAFRVWRLDQPRAMHFDEVYHARSAAEWLANWQNDWTRDVYEWTHPMLAKYLIAAGIVIVDPNKVIGESELDTPSRALAVAPARLAEFRPRSVAFTAGTGSLITAIDLSDDRVVATWQAGGQVASLAFDEDGMRLLAGRGDAGTVEAFDLSAFLGATGERAPPTALAPIETGLDSVVQIVVPGESAPIVFRGSRGLATLGRDASDPVANPDIVAGGIDVVGATGTEGTRVEARVAASIPEDNVVAFFDAATLEPVTDGDGAVEIAIAPALVGPLVATGGGDDQRIFAITGPIQANDEHPALAGGVAVLDGDASELIDVAPLPGAATAIGWQEVANIVYVAGADGDASVLWTMEPHGEDRRETSAGFAVFDSTALPGDALALAFDMSRVSQDDDHGHLLVSTDADGGAQLVTVDAGSNAFAWRIAGIAFGAILVALVYLLAATMFRRRGIAILAAAFVAIDGMSFVMSRIAMNDIFAAVFIVAAYLLFWQVWSGRWRRSAWWALPAVGVLIGLAAATKWVGFYALAGLLILVLARSALGRLLLVAGVMFIAIVAGIGAPWPFLVLMLGIAALALLIVYVRPIRVELDDVVFALPATGLVLGGVGLAFAIAYGQVEGRDPGGAVEILFGALSRGAQAGWPAWIMLGVAGALILLRATASVRNADSDARWYRPKELGGFAWPWVGACLVVVPLTVYALSYVPYLELGHTFAIPDTGPGYRWSLDELHSQMFGYHFGLTAGHASASPWWSWPLDLKPTWFFNESYDLRQTATIYNGGNPILFWAGIPALAVCAVLAWKRRSPALVLIVAAFAFQFLPWTRIERATFAYHYLTAVIFAMVAIAYLVDEALRRPWWRDLALGYLVVAGVALLLIFPLGAALPMPDWYINAARALPPWNYGFQFPNPPSGDRAELLTVDSAKLVAGALLGVVAAVFAIVGRAALERWRGGGGQVLEPLED